MCACVWSMLAYVCDTARSLRKSVCVPVCVRVCVCGRMALAPPPLPAPPSPPPPLSPALREGGVAGVEGGPAPKWGGASPLRSAGGEGGGAWGGLGGAVEECADQSGNESVTTLSSVRGYPWVFAIASVCALVRVCVCVCVCMCACVWSMLAYVCVLVC